LVSLEAARHSFAAGHFGPGTAQLRAFQRKVTAQVAPADQALADQFALAAEQIIALVSEMAGVYGH